MSLFVCLVALSKVVAGHQLLVNQWLRTDVDAGVNARDDDTTFMCRGRGLVCFTGPETAVKEAVVMRTELTHSGAVHHNSTADWASWTTYRRVTSEKSPTSECDKSFHLYMIYKHRSNTYLALLNRTSGVMAGYQGKKPNRLMGIHNYLPKYAFDSVQSTIYHIEDRGLYALKLTPKRNMEFKMFKTWEKKSSYYFLFWEERLKWLMYLRRSLVDNEARQTLYYFIVETGSEVRIRVLEKRLFHKHGVDIKSRMFYYMLQVTKQLIAIPYSIQGSTNKTIVSLEFLKHASTITFSSDTASVLYCQNRRVFNYQLQTGKTSLLFTSNHKSGCPTMHAVGKRIFTFFEHNIREYNFKGKHLSTIYSRMIIYNVKFLKGEFTDSETR